MSFVELDVKLVGEGAEMPRQAYSGDAAFDLRSGVDVEIPPFRRQVIGCAIAIAVPEGYAGLVLPRSGLAAHHGVTVLNSPGLIDAGYRGEVMVTLLNTDHERTFVVATGDRIAQLLLVRLPELRLREVDQLPHGVRGDAGLGSSGL